MGAREWGDVLRALRPGAGGGDVLDRALLLGHDVAAGTVGCSLTEVVATGYRTPAASNALALDLDLAQYDDSAGPCVNAARDGRVQRVDSMASDTRFPGFATAALRHGVHSSLSVPVAGRAQPTALNLYSTAEAAFATERAQRIAQLLGRMLTELARSADPAPQVSPELHRARERGGQVSAVLEDLMSRTGVDRPGAFAALVRRSRLEQATLHRLADDAYGSAGEQ